MKPPVFIVGAPRSGTTLTAKIIGGHPEIYIPGENYFFDDIYSRKRDLGELPSQDVLRKIYARLMSMYGRYNMLPDQERINSLADGPLSLQVFSDCKSYDQVLSLFMEIQTQLVHKSRWGNHTPRDLYNVDDILSFYPEAKIVVCMRDPRDFMLSYKDKWKIRKGQEALRLKSLYHPVITAMHWKSSMKQVLGLRDKVPARNLFILKYESLVAKPEATVRKLCSAIDETFYPEMLEVPDNNSSTVQSGVKGIFSSSAGRWKKQLLPLDAAIMQIIAKNEMKATGYALEELDCPLNLLLYSFFTAPFAVTKGLYMNRQKRGPLLPYLLRRLKPFFRL